MSAKFASALSTAAQPPLLSKPEERNSLNQISALFGVPDTFLTPNINVLIAANVGFPFTLNTNVPGCVFVGKG